MLSHNLYTVLHIPHDPVALEEHFRDDDDGPVSSQGYMPYLNKYILDKVGPGLWGVPLPQDLNTQLWTLSLHSPTLSTLPIRCPSTLLISVPHLSHRSPIACPVLASASPCQSPP